MEGRGLVARYDEALDAFTVWDASQTPHAIRAMLAYLFDLPEHRVRVIAPPDVGGGLGPKASFYPEEALVCWLARRLRRPVKWIEDRLEHFLSAAQEREQIHTVEIAFTERRHPARAPRRLRPRHRHVRRPRLAGHHRLHRARPLSHPEHPLRAPRGLHESAADGAVRGAGRPQGVLVMERMMDRMAETLGLDPADVRFRNLIPRRRVPVPVGMWFRDAAPLTYDSGDYPELLRRALALRRLRRGRAASRRASGPRAAIAASAGHVRRGRRPRALRGRHPAARRPRPHRGDQRRAAQGQGYQTTFAQIAADAVGVRYEDVDVVTGDTGAIPYGVGRFASRVTANAGPAILQAGGALREKILAVAAHLLEAAPADLDIADGAVRVRGVPGRGVPSPQVARLGNGGVAFGMVMPGGLAVGLEASAYFAPSQAGYSASAHICVLDVDPETGEVDDRPLRRRPRLRQGDQPAPRRGADPGRRGPRPLQRPLRGGVLRRAGPAPGRRASSTTPCRRPARCLAWSCST